MRGPIAMNASHLGRTSRALVVVTTLAVAFLLLTARPAHADTFTVNSIGDAGDVAPSGVCNTAPFQQGTEPECTLRAAIQEANATTAADTINFNIGGSGVKTISPATALPDITQPVLIDGYSEPGAKANTVAVGDNAVLLIELSGANGTSSSGLRIKASNSTVKGLVINRFSTMGIHSDSTTGNKIEGNFIGTDPSGTQALGNAFHGVFIDRGSNNTIGGTEPAKRNIISGNGFDGVQILGDSASGNKVEGNYIGTRKDGTTALGNGLNGVTVSGSMPTGNNILSNSIFSNSALGIDLGGAGVTPNDGPGDADTGANNLQNFPVLSSARTGRRTTTIKGTLESTQNGTFTIQFFKNPKDTRDEGKTFVGEKVVSDTDGDGVVSFTFKPSKKVKEGMFVTATATDQATSDTSEFSAPKKVR